MAGSPIWAPSSLIVH